MDYELIQNSEKYRRKRRQKKWWQRIVSVLGCIVVFCTTYALILPAITQERETFCGLEAHTHDDSCYTQLEAAQRTVLTCSAESLGIHVHSDDCYDTEGRVLCGQADYVVHTHDSSCFDADGNLVCSLPEASQHVHGESCYAAQESHTHDESCYTVQQGELICQLPEEQGHTHDESCYGPGETLLCTVAENHVHGDDCYQEALECQLHEDETHTHDESCYSRTLVCTESENHVHDDSCYEQVLQCQTAESEGHAHTAECYEQIQVLNCTLEEGSGEQVLVCTEPEAQVHVHSDSCFQTIADQTLTCGQEESETHTHSQMCYGTWELTCTLEEHTHELICYSDSTADVETAAVWERTFAGVELTGVWAKDLLAIAESQLGYTESTKNYIVLEDGETMKGYTRYGEWYGNPYGDWCAMFVSFCLHYGEVEVISQDANCQNWIDTLKTDGMYASATDYVPNPGDLVFFDYEGDGTADHVGIVEELSHDTLNTIEGNSADQVRRASYDRSDADIVGYGQLPVQLTEEEWAEVENVIAMIDEMPSADEIDAKLAEYEEAEDYEGEEVYYEEVSQQVAEVYYHYSNLSDVQKSYVTNADKLMELEYIWSVTTLAVTTDRPTIYQINSYVDSSSGAAVMVFGGTVAEKVTWQFLDWYAIKVEADANGYLRVIEILQPGVDKSNYRANDTGFVLLFYKYQVIPDAVVGDYVTVHFTIPASGVLKSEGYGKVSFSTSPSGINSEAPTKINSASTSDFVELNLYDYNGNINANYWNEAKEWWYPGFQWNGGAYKIHGISNSNADLGIPDYNADRNMIDSIDFGNSLITNLTYGYGSSGDYTKAINATNVTKTSANYTGSSPINWIYGNDTEGYTNKPIGTSTTDLSYSDVMKDTLVNGYPAMFDGTMLDYLFKPGDAVTKMNTGSIDGLFLFDQASGRYSFNSRDNHAEYVQGENRFQLYDDIITPNFLLYPFGNFLPLNTIDDSGKATQVSAFNYSGGMRNYVERIIADLKNDAEGLGSYWNDTQRQLATMLEEYQENWTLYPRAFSSVSNNWENLSAANAIRDFFWKDINNSGHGPTDDTAFITGDHLARMYNIDWDVQTNFFFGMEMKMNFYQPKNGMTGTDTDGDGDFDYPMEFNFTGDDDVWVYIDDVLFLDLSGIHRHVGGQIDFVNGKVHYYALDTSTGDVSSTPYATYTFKEILTAAGASTANLNEKGTFADYTTHAFNFYYMERGSGSSVCRLNFNFPLLRQNSLSVEKELADDDSTEAVEALGNPDFLFQVLDADDDSLFLPEGWAYSLYDVDGSVIQEIEVTEKYQDGRVKIMTIKDGSGNVLCTEEYDSDGKLTIRTGNGQDKVLRIGDNGIFALKAGQKAEFVGIPETWGKYYVRELLEQTVVGQYGQITVSGTAATIKDVTYGGIAYTGAQSPVLDMTNGSSTFRIQNKITTAKLGSLSITKNLDAAFSGNTSKTFKFNVTLDGKPLPEGMSYTVGSDTMTVTVDKDNSGNVTASYVELTAGQTATISKILAGTAFEVTETTDSAKGYTVTYTVGDSTNSTSAKGVIDIGNTVTVTVRNSENGTSVDIPIAKTMSYFGSTDRSYQFTIEQVADQNGAALDSAGHLDTITLEEPKSDYTKGIFKISYTSNDVPTGETKTYYYKISEVEGTAAVRYDTKYYIVKVVVTNTNDVMMAEVTDVWQVDGETTIHTDGTDMTDTTILFTNTILRNLIVSKTVTGTGNLEQAFEFTLKLEAHESNADLPAELVGTKTDASGNTSSVSYALNADGVATFTLKHGESVKFTNIPYRSKWTLTEKAEDGFLTTYTITANKETKEYTGNTAENQVANAANTTVAFTNAVTYSLPETGGPGTTSYAMAGLMLMLCSAAYLLYRHRKRRREAY